MRSVLKRQGDSRNQTSDASFSAFARAALDDEVSQIRAALPVSALPLAPQTQTLKLPYLWMSENKTSSRATKAEKTPTVDSSEDSPPSKSSANSASGLRSEP